MPLSVYTLTYRQLYHDHVLLTNILLKNNGDSNKQRGLLRERVQEWECTRHVDGMDDGKRNMENNPKEGFREVPTK